MRICFYARLKDKWYFDLLDFYSNDIKIFEELGHEVIKVHNWKNLPDNCDLYFVWWWSSGIVPLIKAKLWKKPVITIGNLHYNDPSEQGYHQRPFYIKWFIKYCLKKSDVQISTSEIEFEGIKNLGAKNPILLYHAIDDRKYKYNNTECRENYIMTLTQLTLENIQRKKVKEIILAFKEVSTEFNNLSLFIVGNKTDSGYEKIKQFVASNNIDDKVKFLGRVSDEEKIKLYQNCRIYIQPTSFEGFGMAIAESMLCGAPVITSRTGAVPEVAGDCALYVNPDVISEISEGIRRILNNRELSEKMSLEGHNRIKNKFAYDLRKKSIKIIIEKYGK